MGEEENRRSVQRYFEAVSAKDFDAMSDLRHNEFIQECPQMKERTRGKQNARLINENHPGLPRPWIKRIMGLRHLLCQSHRGVTIQVYVAFIASLLINRRIGHKPTKRTYEMICLFFQGLASEQELEDHITRLKEASNRKPK